VVSELLEGRTLRQALADGPLPQKTAMDVAIQVARGIGAAHDRGIVHRDLKPENIFLTRDGHAKILDFGLAKLVESASRASAWSDLTTEGRSRRRPGTLLGTVGYMSPEQVRGEATDGRTDIFAFRRGLLRDALRPPRVRARDRGRNTERHPQRRSTGALRAICARSPPRSIASSGAAWRRA
jgi:serine/threonine protein kinase